MIFEGKFNKRMMITIRLRGTRNRFIIVARVFSGTYFPLIVLKDGQKIPTQISNIRKDKNIMHWCNGNMIGIIKVSAEIPRIIRIKDSVELYLEINLKIDEPIMIQSMKEAKMIPWGMVLLIEESLEMAPLKAGVHLITNTYIAPSNND